MRVEQKAADPIILDKDRSQKKKTCDDDLCIDINGSGVVCGYLCNGLATVRVQIFTPAVFLEEQAVFLRGIGSV